MCVREQPGSHSSFQSEGKGEDSEERQTGTHCPRGTGGDECYEDTAHVKHNLGVRREMKIMNGDRLCLSEVVAN